VDIGENRKHVLGYLQDFLFSPERARTPVRALSGGERNRLFLARLFTRTFNVLALDEPTNDLDIETLDLLEDLLMEFTGTLLVVSHDRAFLDNVVTSTLVMEGNGRVGEYVGGYADWLRQRPAPPVAGTRKAPPRATATAAVQPKRRLSIKEQRELANLPDRIHALEQERERLYATLAVPAVLRDGAATASAKARLDTIGIELKAAELRWEELETIGAG
jgi:ATP-binding cassette subfamily F protein uup